MIYLGQFDLRVGYWVLVFADIFIDNA